MSSFKTERVICLIDMDCFYVQVEEVAAPEFRGKPCGVSQYNPYKGGGLIAVNYEARKHGVKRGMRGEEAKALCPEFHTFFVQEKRGKADLAKYRDASLKIFDILGKHFKNVEKASIDEAYIDLTDMISDYFENKKIENFDLTDSFVVGTYNEKDQEANLKAWIDLISDFSIVSNDLFLLIGAQIVQNIRKEIFDSLGFHCSAGIAHNKTLAKLCAGLNKPSKQTILPLQGVEILYKNTQITKIKNLGGKLGMMLCDGLNLNTMEDLSKKSLSELVNIFGDKTGNWLHQISKGIDTEPVLCRRSAKSIGCSKNFRGNQVLNTFTKVENWIKNLCEELEERLESDKTLNQREATLLVVHFTNEAGSFSKSTNLNLQNSGYCSKKLTSLTIELLSGFNKSKIKDQWHPVIYGLGLSATKFVDKENSCNSIQKYFSIDNMKRFKIDETNNQTAAKNIESRSESTDSLLVLDSNSNSRSPLIEDKIDDNSSENLKTLNIDSTEIKKEKEKKNDIKKMLMKQAEKAIVIDPNLNKSSSEVMSKKQQSSKSNKIDLKNMLLKQAEKKVTSAVVQVSVSNEKSMNNENAQRKSTETSKQNKVDLKNMLLKQAEKTRKTPVLKKMNNLNPQAHQTPILITLSDSSSASENENTVNIEEDDDDADYACIKAKLKKNTEKINSIKKRSIEITPNKQPTSNENKKFKSNSVKSLGTNF